MGYMMTKEIEHLKSRAPLNALTKAFGGSLALISLILPGLTLADWNFYPALRIAGDFNDNATLTSRTDDVDSISGFIGEASVAIAYQAQTGMFFIEPIIRTRRYDSDIDFDSDDQFVNFRMRHSGEFNTISLRGNYSRESVRTAELGDVDLDADIDPDEIEDDDTGRVDLRQHRERLRVVPQWRYQMTDVSTIVADVNFVGAIYDGDNQQVFRLSDYTDIRARLMYERALSARNTGVVVVTARNYQTDFLDGDYAGYGLSVGVYRELTQTSTFRALVGLEQAEQINSVDDKPHFVADVSYVRHQETTRLLAQYRRTVSASGRGALTVRDEINLRFVRDLNDRFAAGLGARAYQSTRLGIIENETDYVQLHAQLLWRLSKAFSLQANYRYTVIDRSIIGESANANRFTLWFSYQPNSQSGIRLQP